MKSSIKTNFIQREKKEEKNKPMYCIVNVSIKIF